MLGGAKQRNAALTSVLGVHCADVDTKAKYAATVRFHPLLRLSLTH